MIIFFFFDKAFYRYEVFFKKSYKEKRSSKVIFNAAGTISGLYEVVANILFVYFRLFLCLLSLFYEKFKSLLFLIRLKNGKRKTRKTARKIFKFLLLFFFFLTFTRKSSKKN